MKSHRKFQGSPSARSHCFPASIGAASVAPRLNLAERLIAADLAKLEENILTHCDRPGIELRILNWLAQSHGPTTEGVAAKLGLGVHAAEFHLACLAKAGRVWKQPGVAGQDGWHVTSEGHRFSRRFAGDAMA
jgi:hypothetical protein